MNPGPKGAYGGLRALGAMVRDQGPRYPGHPGRSHVSIRRMLREKKVTLELSVAGEAELNGDVCPRNTCRSMLPDPAWVGGEPPYRGASGRTKAEVRRQQNVGKATAPSRTTGPHPDRHGAPTR